MKQTNNMYRKLILLAISIILAACSREDGDWDPMEWDNRLDNTEVAAKGGSYSTTCKNYPSFWIGDIMENGQYVEITDPKLQTADGGWYVVSINGKKATFVFHANDSGTERTASVTLTAGDTFYTFRFKQKAQ